MFNANSKIFLSEIHKRNSKDITKRNDKILKCLKSFISWSSFSACDNIKCKRFYRDLTLKKIHPLCCRCRVVNENIHTLNKHMSQIILRCVCGRNECSQKIKIDKNLLRFIRPSCICIKRDFARFYSLLDFNFDETVAGYYLKTRHNSKGKFCNVFFCKRFFESKVLSRDLELCSNCHERKIEKKTHEV